MTHDNCTITVLPGSNRIPCEKGETVRSVLLRESIRLSDFCGGEGSCGKCYVRFESPFPPITTSDKIRLSQEKLQAGYRLACTVVMESDVTLYLPEDTVNSEARTKGVFSVNLDSDSELKTSRLELNPATLGNQKSDLETVKDALDISDAVPTIHFLKKLPQTLRENNYKVNVTRFNERLLDINTCAAPHEKSAGPFGVAFDLGTTTIAGALYDLSSGKMLADNALLNPQTDHGADVISRISYASKSVGNLSELRKMAVGQLNEITRQLCGKSGIMTSDVGFISVAGNATMLHLLLEVSPETIAVSPYVPVFKDSVLIRAEEIDLLGHPEAMLYVFPGIGGFVGGDTIADILSAGLDKTDELSLMIDIGTNGEIVLGKKGRILATSAAAGPAFEGQKISCGMRAEPGAVDSVKISEAKLVIHTIGDISPCGVCGTGLISFVASMLDEGVIEVSGRFSTSADSPIAGYLKDTSDGPEFRLTDRVTLSQRDIREFQLAKGAISAAAKLMLKEYGADLNDIANVYLAGAFGSFLDPAAAVRIGLVPDVSLNRIVSIGDAALAGAAHALLRKDLRKRCDIIARSVKFIEMAGRSDFQDVFAESMLFL